MWHKPLQRIKYCVVLDERNIFFAHALVAPKWTNHSTLSPSDSNILTATRERLPKSYNIAHGIRNMLLLLRCRPQLLSNKRCYGSSDVWYFYRVIFSKRLEKLPSRRDLQWEKYRRANGQPKWISGEFMLYCLDICKFCMPTYPTYANLHVYGAPFIHRHTLFVL